MTSNHPIGLTGGCACGTIRYRLDASPLCVNCCHCRYCQRETGTAFALNCLIEASSVTVISSTSPRMISTPTIIDMPQMIARCPECFVAVWSNYAAMGPFLHCLRVGTLDDPDKLPPDFHIWTSSKQPWVVIPEGAIAMEEYYEREKYWSAESLKRVKALEPMVEKWKGGQRGTDEGGGAKKPD